MVASNRTAMKRHRTNIILCGKRLVFGHIGHLQNGIITVFPFKNEPWCRVATIRNTLCSQSSDATSGGAYIWDSNPSLTLSAKSSGSTSTLLTMRNIASFKRCPSSSIAFPENTKHLRQYNRLNILSILSKVNVPSRWLNLESVRGFTFNNAENDRLDLKPHLP